MNARSWCASVAIALYASVSAHAACAASFDWFEYVGRDDVFAEPLPSGHYRNPILAGFYPDPSVTRAGDKFYLVNSSFAYFPGIPVFESDDLVHWRQLGHAIDRPSQLDFTNLGVSRGVFAPTIEHDGDRFYIFNTHVDGGGNFVITAETAAGPWSDPIWLPELEGGIDPSMFLDADGRAYLLNNGPPEGKPRYDGHRAIWIQEFDRASLRTKGPRRVLVDGGIHPAERPIWIEGPHLFKRDGWYYLNCAEGGTGPQHSQVILRSRSPWGPFEAGRVNPILTQRGLPSSRAHPVTNAGHADLVEASDGRWWATFLASRTYDQRHYNTGRETFLLPVEWRDGWPVILQPGVAIPSVVRGPRGMRDQPQAPLTGNFTWRDDFDKATLDLAWLRLRTSDKPWFDLERERGRVSVAPRDPIDSKGAPAFLGRRQQHLTFDASTSLQAPTVGTSAGILLAQNETHWLFVGAKRAGKAVNVFVEQRGGGDVQRLVQQPLGDVSELQFKVSADRRNYSFFVRPNDTESWRLLASNVDGSILSTDRAGGFVGAVLGPYVRLDQTGAKND